MARLITNGFESNSTAADAEFDSTTGTPVVQSVTKRSGTYAAQITSLVSATRKAFMRIFAASNSDGPYFVRAYFRYTAPPSAENRLLALITGTGFTGAAAAYLTVDNAGVLRLYDDVGVIGSPSSALTAGVWYRLGLHFDRSPAPGSEVVRGYVDGVEFAGEATRTITGQVRSLIVGGNLAAEAQTAGDWYFDDLAVNDGTGSFQTTLPGAGNVLHLLPNAAGDNAAWTPTAGANFENVDEVTPDDATTLVSSNTLDQIDDHNIVATPAELQSGDAVTLVHISTRHNGAGASANASFVVRVKASASGTVEESTAITPANTTWRSHRAAAPFIPLLTLYDLPGGSTTAWTKTDLDAAQVGYRLSVVGTNAAQITKIWLTAEYVGTAPPAAVSRNNQNLLLMGVG